MSIPPEIHINSLWCARQKHEKFYSFVVVDKNVSINYSSTVKKITVFSSQSNVYGEIICIIGHTDYRDTAKMH